MSYSKVERVQKFRLLRNKYNYVPSIAIEQLRKYFKLWDPSKEQIYVNLLILNNLFNFCYFQILKMRKIPQKMLLRILLKYNLYRSSLNCTTSIGGGKKTSKKPY